MENNVFSHACEMFEGNAVALRRLKEKLHPEEVEESDFRHSLPMGSKTGSKLKFSYFQLTFGQEEAYLHLEETYRRLKKYGYDAIEITPPKGRYGMGVSMEKYVKVHKKLMDEYGLAVSCINECWGEKWDPYSPAYKTLTEKKTAALAISETKTSIDFASELKAPFVTVANHKALIEMTERDNIGIQIDWFHANFEELNPYEAVMDAQPLLWHMHFRDSNSLTPGYGTVDFKAVMRALLKTGYDGYCTIESAPMIPDSDTACRDGIEYLKLMARIAAYQTSDAFPNGFSVKR